MNTDGADAKPAEASDYLERSRTLLGDDALCALSRIRVAVFGLGGVGGWCAEALVRTGVRHIMLVDADAVAPSNVNRQVMATPAAVGQRKTDALAARLAEIAPDAEIETRNVFYDETTAPSFDLGLYDYVIDAIDSVRSKALLIRSALESQCTTLLSSMGAARRIDPSRVKAVEFSKVQGDGLARAVRAALKKTGGIPARKFICACSDEPPLCDGLGSVVTVTAAFGLLLASLVVRQVRQDHPSTDRYFSSAAR